MREGKSLQLYPFTGKEDDLAVGLTYFGKRYLVPALGTRASADPLAVHSPGKADLNLYAYVSGYLLRATDPVGLLGSGGPDDAAPEERKATNDGSTAMAAGVWNAVVSIFSGADYQISGAAVDDYNMRLEGEGQSTKGKEWQERWAPVYMKAPEGHEGTATWAGHMAELGSLPWGKSGGGSAAFAETKGTLGELAVEGEAAKVAAPSARGGAAPVRMGQEGEAVSGEYMGLPRGNEKIPPASG